MISSSTQETLNRFNRVALTRIAVNEFDVPAEPPFWLLPFLDQGRKQKEHFVFDDELSFVANFLIDAEESWTARRFGGTTSGIYSIQSGDSPELFYECRADWLHGEAVLLVELLGEGSPGSIYESVRAARSQRLAEGTENGRQRNYLESAVDTSRNGLPVMQAALDSGDGVTQIRVNSALYGSDRNSMGAEPTIEGHWGEPIAQEIRDRARSVRSRRQTVSWSMSLPGKDARMILVEAAPDAGGSDSIELTITEVTEHAGTEQWLQAMDHRSRLTGLLNDATIDERIRVAAELAESRGKWLGLLNVSLDGFVSINLTYGRQAGEALLAAMAERLVAHLQPLYTVFHMGEDKFVVMLEQQDQTSDLKDISDSVWEALNKPYALRFLSQVISSQVDLTIYAGDVESFTGSLIRP